MLKLLTNHLFLTSVEVQIVALVFLGHTRPVTAAFEIHMKLSWMKS